MLTKFFEKIQFSGLQQVEHVFSRGQIGAAWLLELDRVLGENAEPLLGNLLHEDRVVTLSGHRSVCQPEEGAKSKKRFCYRKIYGSSRTLTNQGAFKKKRYKK